MRWCYFWNVVDRECKMEKLQLELENCYGIRKLKETIDYSENNVAVIYAPNGTMKSSLAKTFKVISKGDVVKEEIYGHKSSYTILADNSEIPSEEIIVINPFEENSYEREQQGLLMADESLRNEYLQIYKSIEEKKAKLYSQVKEVFGYSSRSNFDIKNTLLQDLGKTVQQEYVCLEKIASLLNNSDMNLGLDVSFKKIRFKILRPMKNYWAI